VLLQALILLPLNVAGLRVIGYRRWCDLLAWWLPQDPPQKSAVKTSSVDAQRIAQLVHSASREGLWTGACLESALSVWWLLRRRAFAAELRIGGRKEGDTFEAHAWVELGGTALNDDQALQQYVAFENVPNLSKAKLP
jgi:hypothetical protein